MAAYSRRYPYYGEGEGGNEEGGRKGDGGVRESMYEHSKDHGS